MELESITIDKGEVYGAERINESTGQKSFEEALLDVCGSLSCAAAIGSEFSASLAVIRPHLSSGQSDPNGRNESANSLSGIFLEFAQDIESGKEKDEGRRSAEEVCRRFEKE